MCLCNYGSTSSIEQLNVFVISLADGGVSWDHTAVWSGYAIRPVEFEGVTKAEPPSFKQTKHNYNYCFYVEKPHTET